jgi:hypothetical protein
LIAATAPFQHRSTESISPVTGEWPSDEAVWEIVAYFTKGAHLLDLLSLSTYGVIDRDDPFEPVEGAPVPDAAELAALTTLTEMLGDDLERCKSFLAEFVELRKAAVYQQRAVVGTRPS